MPRRTPNRRRRRPGRRPPNRVAGRHAPPPPRGFTPEGLRPLYAIFLPGLRGRAKRAWFNGLCRYLVAGFAVAGGAMGYAWLGALGGLLGLAGGLVAGGFFVERRRFYRH